VPRTKRMTCLHIRTSTCMSTDIALTETDESASFPCILICNDHWMWERISVTLKPRDREGVVAQALRLIHYFQSLCFVERDKLVRCGITTNIGQIVSASKLADGAYIGRSGKIIILGDCKPP